MAVSKVQLMVEMMAAMTAILMVVERVYVQVVLTAKKLVVLMVVN
jgi:hypothetical protein